MFDQLDTEDQKLSSKKPTDWSGTIISVALIPVYLLFVEIGREDAGLSICICLGMVLLAVRIRWDLKRRVWFWCVIGALLALHVPLIMRMSWLGIHITRISLLPIGVADLAITLGILRFVEKFIVKPVANDESAN